LRQFVALDSAARAQQFRPDTFAQAEDAVQYEPVAVVDIGQQHF